MSRGEQGVRPLLIDIIKWTISFMQDIQKRKASFVFQAWKFESNNDILPNFIERNNMKCFHCKGKIEKESHFVISCPLYNARKFISNMR